MGIYLDIKEHLKEKSAELKGLKKEIQAYENSIRSGRYAPEVVSEMQAEIGNLKFRASQIKELTSIDISRKLKEYIETESEADMLNPADINDDVKLLNAGISITADEVQKLMDRNAGNRTTQQIISRYAKEHGIILARDYISAKKAANDNAEKMRMISQLYIDHWIDDNEQADNMLEQFMPE